MDGSVPCQVVGFCYVKEAPRQPVGSVHAHHQVTVGHQVKEELFLNGFAILQETFFVIVRYAPNGGNVKFIRQAEQGHWLDSELSQEIKAGRF